MLKKIHRGYSRELIIYFALVFEISYEKTQILLHKFGESELYARDRRDTIIIWALYHQKDIKEVNQLCENYGCEQVGKFTNMKNKDLRRFLNKSMLILDLDEEVLASTKHII